MREQIRHMMPVDWLPSGLISWYGPQRRALAMVTSWMALVCGDVPRLRAAWTSQAVDAAWRWAGGDFVLNVPDEDCLPKVRQLVTGGKFCLDVEDDLGLVTVQGELVAAPRLLNCAVQLECCHGAVSATGGEPEVSGEVLLLHRGDVDLRPADVADFCMINPFGLQMPRALVN